MYQNTVAKFSRLDLYNSQDLLSINLSAYYQELLRLFCITLHKFPDLLSLTIKNSFLDLLRLSLYNFRSFQLTCLQLSLAQRYSNDMLILCGNKYHISPKLYKWFYSPLRNVPQLFPSILNRLPYRYPKDSLQTLYYTWCLVRGTSTEYYIIF